MRRITLALLSLTLFAGLMLADDAPKEGLLFQEDFSKKLDKGWSWIREDAKAWKKGEGGLLIRTFPSETIWLDSNNARNILLREMPDVKDGVLLADVQVSHELFAAFELAGVLWYVDDDNWAFVVKEKLKEGSSVVLTREEKGKGKGVKHIAYDNKDVELRLRVSKDKIEGWYRPNEKDRWEKIGECEPPSQAKARIGLIACHGPKDKENWARFRKFRLSEPVE
jgi:regulation of enolase protein 1 (concanavalin A-like superfamily)